MSLGMGLDVEQDILDALADLGHATSIQVAYWRLQRKRQPLYGGAAIGLTMMRMEAQGRLRFDGHTYEVITP